MKNFTQVPNELIINAKLDAYEFRVLIVLMHLNPCHPSLQKLAEWTGFNKKTVQRALRTLRFKNVIQWHRGMKGRNNQYLINPTSVWTLERGAPAGIDRAL